MRLRLRQEAQEMPWYFAHPTELKPKVALEGLDPNQAYA